MRTTLAILATFMLLLMLCSCPPQAPSGNGGTGGGPSVDRDALGGKVALPLEITVDDPAFQAMDFTDQRMYALARAIGAPLLLPDFGNDGSRHGVAIADPEVEDYRVWKFNLPYAVGHDDDHEYLGLQYKSLFTAHVNGPSSQLRAEIIDLVEGAGDVASGDLDISGIEVDGNEISFTLTRPYAGFGTWLTQPGLSLTGMRFSADGESLSSEGFGPWRIDGLVSDEEGDEILKLVPNPNSMLGEPVAEELWFFLEPDRRQQVDLFRAGHLDAANLPADFGEFDGDEALGEELVDNETAVTLLALFDHGQDPWGDQVMQDKVGLRQSLALCIDRETLEAENNGQVRGWGHFLPDHFRSGIPMELLNKPTYPRTAMLEEARAKQKESDHEQGSHLPQNMDVAYLEHDNLAELNNDLVEFWADISIRMQPFPLSHTDMLRRLELNSHEVIVFWNYPAWPSADACFYPQMYSALIGEGGNWSRIDDPKVDELIEGMQKEADPSLARLYQQQLSELIEERGLFVPAAYLSPSLLVSPELAVDLGPYDFNASLQGQDFTLIGIRQD